jgi:hypothetical protein
MEERQRERREKRSSPKLKGVRFEVKLRHFKDFSDSFTVDWHNSSRSPVTAYD